MSPKDEDELADMLFTATHQAIPSLIRYPRGPAEGVPVKEQQRLLEVGKAEVLRHFSNNGGRRIAIFPLGNLCSMGCKAADVLSQEGFDVAVINPRFTKPLDAATTEFFARGADVVLTMEDHSVVGGYGSAVLELLNEKGIHKPVVMIGWPDQFVEHATTQDELRQKYGLTVENAVARARESLEQVQPTGAASGLRAL
jgi:1-deoxy-D-xylulose-5-phosphate synthase